MLRGGDCYVRVYLFAFLKGVVTAMREFDAIIIGAGQAGPSLAGRLTAAGM